MYGRYLPGCSRPFGFGAMIVEIVFREAHSFRIYEYFSNPTQKMHFYPIKLVTADQGIFFIDALQSAVKSDKVH